MGVVNSHYLNPISTGWLFAELTGQLAHMEKPLTPQTIVTTSRQRLMSNARGTSMVRKSLIAIAALVAGLVPLTVWNTTVHAATFTVTSLADDGSTGTLRWAMTQANSAAGADIIDFDNSLSGTITLLSSLPAITENLTIVGLGQDDLIIDGVGSYRPFTVTTSGVQFTLSDMTLRRGGSGGHAQLILNSRATISATRVTFKETTGTAVANWEAGSVATYTNCIFSNNNNGIIGDHGSTPSSVSNTDTDYQNRTYVVNSLFENNVAAINQERFTHITNSTFRNNVWGARINGLNRTQIYSSTFSNNSIAISHFNWTPVEWTSVGRNNRIHDGNTFEDNGVTFALSDSWNSGQRSQQWTTISNNSWDGSGTWISAERWSGSANVTDTVTAVNTSGREWIETNNIDYRTTTTTTTTTTTLPPVTTVAPVVTTVAPSSSTNESNSAVVDTNVVSAPQTSRQNSTVTTVVPPAIVTTTVPPTTTTTTTIPAPSAPELSSGESGALVDGEEVETTLTRSNNALVVSGAGIEASVYGLSPEGARIDLDEDGLLRLETQDQVVVEAAGYEVGNVVDVWMYSTPTRLGQLIVDATGAIKGSFALPETLESGDHRVVLDGQNNRGQDVVLGIGVSVGEVDQSSLASRLLIIIPVSLAILAALIIPTTLRRRREEHITD